MVPEGMGKRDLVGVAGILYLEDLEAKACSAVTRGTCDVHGGRPRSTTYGYPCAPEEGQEQKSY